MSELRAIEATVTGRVQGVGFRFTTQRIGSQLGLTGWVKNQPDGSVRTRAQGDPKVVDRFLAYLEEGPPASRVTAVTVTEVAPETSLADFRVRA